MLWKFNLETLIKKKFNQFCYRKIFKKKLIMLKYCTILLTQLFYIVNTKKNIHK
jgi:hypothetical protein